MYRAALLAVGVLALLFSTGTAQPPEKKGEQKSTQSRIEKKTYEFKDAGKQMEYALFVPSTYDKAKKTPLVVALHGCRPDAPASHSALFRQHGVANANRSPRGGDDSPLMHQPGPSVRCPAIDGDRPASRPSRTWLDLNVAHVCCFFLAFARGEGDVEQCEILAGL